MGLKSIQGNKHREECFESFDDGQGKEAGNHEDSAGRDSKG